MGVHTVAPLPSSHALTVVMKMSDLSTVEQRRVEDILGRTGDADARLDDAALDLALERIARLMTAGASTHQAVALLACEVRGYPIEDWAAACNRRETNIEQSLDRGRQAIAHGPDPDDNPDIGEVCAHSWSRSLSDETVAVCRRCGASQPVDAPGGES